MKPELTVVIPTLNEAGYVGRLLECLERQTYRNFEVVVADTASTDQTVAEARGFAERLPLVPGLIYCFSMRTVRLPMIFLPS